MPECDVEAELVAESVADIDATSVAETDAEGDTVRVGVGGGVRVMDTVPVWSAVPLSGVSVTVNVELRVIVLGTAESVIDCELC